MSAHEPTARELGLLRGAATEVDSRGTLANWQRAPRNRWGFQHVRKLVPSAPISRGGSPPRDVALSWPSCLDG